MKKLIALLFCLAVAVVTAHAEYPKPTDKLGKVENRVKNTVQRKVTLRVFSSADLKREKAVEGTAVIMGADVNGHMVLITSKDLAVAIDSLADEVENLSAEIAGDGKGASKVLHLLSYTPGTNRYHYKVTLNRGAGNLGWIGASQALSLMK